MKKIDDKSRKEIGIPMSMSELKQRLLKIELARIGFRDAVYSGERDAIMVNPSGQYVMEVWDNGNVCHSPEYSGIAHEIRTASRKANEMVAAWEKAPHVTFPDITNFRILFEHNDIVLAARDDSGLGYGHGLYFVTWEYDYGHTGMGHGHYTADYAAAKEDFAVRCGMVRQDRLFDETEMKLIRQGLVFMGANFRQLTAGQNTLLGKVVERIERLVPEIREHEEQEELGLVPEDGLEA